MIYSNDINKVCGLCINSDKLNEDEENVFCRLNNEKKSITSPDCGNFKYDIFKKTVHRKKRLKEKDFNPEDFTL